MSTPSLLHDTGYRCLSAYDAHRIEQAQARLDEYIHDLDGRIVGPPSLADFECKHGALATDVHVRCDCFA